MINYWFIADYHFCHTNLREEYRPQWDNDEEMNEALVENHNELVKRNDIVHFVGDFTWRSQGIQFLERLNGQFFFIHGNHDNKSITNKLKNYKNIVWHGEQKEVKVYGQKIFLNHYLMTSWNCSHWGAWQIHGHHHTDDYLKVSIGKTMNVGVDANDYKPVSFEQVREFMSTRPDNWNLMKGKI